MISNNLRSILQKDKEIDKKIARSPLLVKWNNFSSWCSYTRDNSYLFFWIFSFFFPSFWWYFFFCLFCFCWLFLVYAFLFFFSLFWLRLAYRANMKGPLPFLPGRKRNSLYLLRWANMKEASVFEDVW